MRDRCRPEQPTSVFSSAPAAERAAWLTAERPGARGRGPPLTKKLIAMAATAACVTAPPEAVVAYLRGLGSVSDAVDVKRSMEFVSRHGPAQHRANAAAAVKVFDKDRIENLLAGVDDARASSSSSRGSIELEGRSSSEGSSSSDGGIEVAGRSSSCDSGSGEVADRCCAKCGKAEGSGVKLQRCNGACEGRARYCSPA